MNKEQVCSDGTVNCIPLEKSQNIMGTYIPVQVGKGPVTLIKIPSKIQCEIPKACLTL